MRDQRNALRTEVRQTTRQLEQITRAHEAAMSRIAVLEHSLQTLHTLHSLQTHSLAHSPLAQGQCALASQGQFAAAQGQFPVTQGHFEAGNTEGQFGGGNTEGQFGGGNTEGRFGGGNIDGQFGAGNIDGQCAVQYAPSAGQCAAT